MTKILLIYNARLLDESQNTPGAVLLIDEKIRCVFQGYFTNSETVMNLANSVLKEDGYSDEVKVELYDAGGLTVTPAFIDMHVHLRYPGQTDKEDLNTGLHSAAAGGFGTIVAMPNTNPVVSTYEEALQIDKEALQIGLTHLFQTTSITSRFDGQNTDHLNQLERKYVPVITEDGKDVLSSAVMLQGMTIAGNKGIIVSCHSEDPTLAAEARPYRQKALELMKSIGLSAWGTSDVENEEDFFAENSDIINQIDLNLTKANELLALAEDIATERNIALAREADCHVHIAHVSTANAINSIREAKMRLMDEQLNYEADEAEAAYESFSQNEDFKPADRYPGGFKISCEVTPHHLALCGTDEPFIRALVNPPLRSDGDRIALIEALRDGTADVISTDHAPHTLEDKAAGSPGFTGEETAYAVCNTVLVKQCQFKPEKLSQLMSANPARILGLNKGKIKSGYDADLVLVDPDEKWTVRAADFYSKGKATPFEGFELTGKVKGLILDGRIVFER